MYEAIARHESCTFLLKSFLCHVLQLEAQDSTHGWVNLHCLLKLRAPPGI